MQNYTFHVNLPNKMKIFIVFSLFLHILEFYKIEFPPKVLFNIIKMLIFVIISI